MHLDLELDNNSLYLTRHCVRVHCCCCLSISMKPTAPTPPSPTAPPMAGSTEVPVKAVSVTAATPAPMMALGSTPLQLLWQVAVLPFSSMHWWTLKAIPSSDHTRHLSHTNSFSWPSFITALKLHFVPYCVLKYGYEYFLKLLIQQAQSVSKHTTLYFGV